MSLQNRVEEFVRDEVYDNAELLGSFMISLAQKYAALLPATGKGSLLKSFVIYADALKAKGDSRRAVEYYKQALNQRKNIRTSSSSLSSGSNTSTKTSERKADSSKALLILEADIKFRIARCYAALNHRQAALKMLESISTRYRTPSMLLWLGRLYRESGMDRPTLNAYQEALSNSPYALKASLTLLRLGVDASDVAELVLKRADNDDHGWLSKFIEAHGKFSLNQHADALSAFVSLDKEVPNNAHVLVNLGTLQVELNDKKAAIILFQKARAADSKSLYGLDTYASLIRHQRDHSRLNSLTRELMDINDTRPEPWIAVALFFDLRGDTMSAIQFVCKALELDPLHVQGYHLKGTLQLAMSQPELSVTAFYKAYSIRRDFAAYKGLVNAYLEIPKVSEALRTAKEALQLMPKDARALLLVGRVLAHSPGEGRKKAGRWYVKALKLDPLCFEAATAFADLYLAQRKSMPDSDLTPAIQMLTQCLQHRSEDYLHVKLGDVYTAAADYGNALTQYHDALSIDPDFEAAKIGIERLEKLLRGVDPDADEDGDYGLENEDDYEQDI